MHILLIHQAFAAINEPGGTRHHEIARVLAQHGHQVTIITSPVSYLTGDTLQRKNRWVSREEPEPGITILRTYTYSALHRSFVHRVLSFLSFMVSSFFVGLGVRNVTHVWGTSPPIFQGWTAWLLARLKGVPFIFEVRDLWPAFAIAVGVLKNPLLIRLSEWLEKFLYRHADEMMVNSPGFIDHLSQRGAKRITLVENGVDVSMFDPHEKGLAFRDQYHLDDDFVVLYAGAHGLSNNLGVILDAARLTRANPKIKFVFVGDGKEKANLVARAETDGLTNVVFTPSVPKNSMGTVLAAADVCVAILKPIDLYKTTYPNKVFDYMAAAKPVFLMIDGVIREVIDRAGCGIFIDPADSTRLAETALRLSQDNNALAEMGLRGRKFVEENFNRIRLAEKMERVFLSTHRNRKN